MTNNIQDFDLKDELIAERKVGHFDKPDDMSSAIYKAIINIYLADIQIGYPKEITCNYCLN